MMVLHLFSADRETLTLELQQKYGRMQGFFRNAPVVIDLAAIAEADEPVDFISLCEQLRNSGLAPVGARNGSPAQHSAALKAGLGLLAAAKNEPSHEIQPVAASEPKPQPAPLQEATPEVAPPTEAEPETLARPTAKIINHPIRSGQRIVAPHGDLVVLGPVNAGAEILAEGSIHVYGALRGRALAGVRGDTDARIHCMQFAPELVAIAGEYLVNDELLPDQMGKTVSICLENDKLKIEILGSFVPQG